MTNPQDDSLRDWSWISQDASAQDPRQRRAVAANSGGSNMLRALARYLGLPDPYPSVGDDDSDGLHRSGDAGPNEPYRSSITDQSRATLPAPSKRLPGPDPANAPYQNNAGLLEQVSKVSAPQTPGSAQSAPKLDGSQETSGAPHQTLNVSAEGVPDIGRNALEEGLYREWYNARGEGRLTDANQIGDTYLQQFPQGKYSKWVQSAKTQFAPGRWQTASRRGAGAYISTSAIENMRKNGTADAQILRYIQDEVARQAGLNDAEIQYLTQAFGQHPFANIVEPGTNLKSSIDSIIQQCRTNAGLSEFYIHPDLLAAIHSQRAAYRPLDSIVESASKGMSTGGLKEFLLGIAADTKIQAQVPSVATAAGLLASSPKAVALLAAVDAGALEHASGVVQTLANIREYLTNPKQAAGTLMDFLMGGSLSEHKVGQTVVKSQLAPMPKSELAETLAEAASDVAANRGGLATSSTLRQGTRMLLDMLPTMLAGETGMPGLLAYGFAERAHVGPDAAALNAAMLAGPFFLISKSPLGGVVRNALADAIDGQLGVTSEMAETATKMTPASLANKISKAAAMAEGGLTEAERAQGARTVRALQARLTVANSEAISSATREIRNRMLREVGGLSGEAATKAATFLITSEAITAVKEGRFMTRDELVQGASLLAAFEALPVLQEANRIRGELPQVPRDQIASEQDVRAGRGGTRLIGTGQEPTEDIRATPSPVTSREMPAKEVWRQPSLASDPPQTALVRPSSEAHPSAQPQSEGLLAKIRRYSNPETLLEKIRRALVGEGFPGQSQQPIQPQLLPARNLPLSQPEGFLKHLQRLSRPETMLEGIQRIALSPPPANQHRAPLSGRLSRGVQPKRLPVASPETTASPVTKTPEDIAPRAVAEISQGSPQVSVPSVDETLRRAAGPDGSLELSLSGMRSQIVLEHRMADEGHAATDTAQSMLDRAYHAAVLGGNYNGVDLFVGGTGSGKSVTSEATPLSASRRARRIIVESHAENAERLAAKIDQAVGQGLPVDVHVVIRDPVESYKSVVERYNRAEAKQPGSGKVVPVNYGAATHEAVVNNVPALTQRYANEPLVKWHFFHNSGIPEAAEPVSPEEGGSLLTSIDTSDLHTRFDAVLDNAKLNRRDRERFAEQRLPTEFSSAEKDAEIRASRDSGAIGGDKGIMPRGIHEYVLGSPPTVQGSRETTTSSRRSEPEPDVFYVLDDAGLTIQAEGRITGRHRGRSKGYRPEPVGGRNAGDHRGHLVPENGVEDPSLVNVRENIISESPGSNLGPKKVIDNLACRIGDENPDSVVRITAEPHRRAGERRPFAVTYWIKKDGIRIHGLTIFNRD